jgi:hypothetical protein
MPDDLETLRAAAKVLEALRSDPAEAAPVAEAPAEAPQPTPQASSLRDVGVAGEGADLGPAPPAGKAPLRTLDDIEGLSQREFDQRFAEVQHLMKQAGR